MLRTPRIPTFFYRQRFSLIFFIRFAARMPMLVRERRYMADAVYLGEKVRLR